jgi:hypothetical protein
MAWASARPGQRRCDAAVPSPVEDTALTAGHLRGADPTRPLQNDRDGGTAGAVRAARFSRSPLGRRKSGHSRTRKFDPVSDATERRRQLGEGGICAVATVRTTRHRHAGSNSNSSRNGHGGGHRGHGVREPYPCAATGGPNADAAAIGWLGNAQGATACLGGSFYVPNGINTEYGFGVYN